MSKPIRLLLSLSAVLAIPAGAWATCGGGGGGGMGGIVPRGAYMDPASQTNDRGRPNAYVVPWNELKPGDAPLNDALVLYWFPATADEMQRGELVASRMLSIFASQCVGMQLVNPDDKTTIARWGVERKLPVALLTSGDKAVGRTDSDRGVLHVSDVENMVHHELYLRSVALDAELADAKKRVGAGDREGAITAYENVWQQHCLEPDEGREAQKALRKLGVTVKDAQLRTADPVITPEMNRKMTEAMSRAFAAELAGRYLQARSLYLAASEMDPADPVPLRYLGELYRHETGQWDLAMQAFQRLLSMQADPLSRAVALHGIGKMTIHMGDSAKGLALFQQSIETYPLALTYRNMAVYWNSERNRTKADAYVQKAMELDPKDPYNLVFAATYMADSGHQDQALQIAKQNENLLSASYNLAAIYALLGNKGKAMELLHRHFYEYERCDAVRAKEMWEARVDYVFASMKDDPDFIKLTALAK